MKSCFCMIVIAMLGSGPVIAGSNFVTNPYLPYPPGCAQVPVADAEGRFGPSMVAFFKGVVELHDIRNNKRVKLWLKVYRSRCSEPNRSLIWLQFSLPKGYANRTVEIRVPQVIVDAAGWDQGMNLVTEMSNWGLGHESDRERTTLVTQQQGSAAYYFDAPEVRRWLFLLDNPTRFSFYWDSHYGLTAGEYNSAFRLSVDELVIDVPATAHLLRKAAPRIPLSGRLSGDWVSDGALNQGFAIAISSQVRAVTPEDEINRDDLPLVISLSHHTFDAQQELLWLTGSATFMPGVSEVTVPMGRTVQGGFRGVERAQRETIGNVRIIARNCNFLRIEYDYSTLGLGAGHRRLQRYQSLETAGYDCRDYAARVAANAE